MNLNWKTSVSVLICLISVGGCARKSVPCSSYEASRPALTEMAAMILPSWNPQPPKSAYERTSCEDAERYLKEQLIWRLYPSYPYHDDGLMPERYAAGCDVNILSSTPENALPAGSFRANTNDQVAGVEEGDIVQHDGSFLYLLRARSIEVVSTEHPDRATRVATFPLTATGVKMVLDQAKGRLVVFTSEESGFGAKTSVLSVDIREPSLPLLLAERRFPGVLSDVRLVNHQLIFVLSDSMDYPAGLKSIPEDVSVEERIQIQEYNKRTIREARIFSAAECGEDGLPGYGYAVTRIIASDSELKSISEQILLGETSARTFSEQTAHLAQNAGDSTYLFSFRTNGSKLRLEAVGEFKGSLLNQFSMDEWKKELRVAVEFWEEVPDSRSSWSRRERASSIRVFREEKGRWELVGATPSLAPRESIKSVRFAGERAYLVTFLRMDPLFTVDLSDAERPRVVGELKIPGYSSYVQLVGSDGLVGVGREGTSLQVSLFDVSNLATPQAVVQHRFLGEASEAEFDHLAFRISNDARYLALPVSDASSGGVRVFDLNASGDALSLKPKLIHWRSAGESVRRTLFLGDLVYLINSRSLAVLDVTKDGAPIVSISLNAAP